MEDISLTPPIRDRDMEPKRKKFPPSHKFKNDYKKKWIAVVKIKEGEPNPSIVKTKKGNKTH